MARGIPNQLVPCKQCGRMYQKTSPRQYFCSTECWKESPETKAKHAEARKKKASKIKVGTLIKHVTLMEPVRGAKSLWDGFGYWHPRNETDFCYECGTTIYKHKAHGICMSCYEKLRQRDPEKHKAAIKASQDKQNARRREATKWLNMAKQGEIPVTPTISNLLDNLE